MRAPWAIVIGTSLLLALATVPTPASPHELPSFPRASVVAVRPDPLRPLSWSYTIEVLDPSGRNAVPRADVRITGFERSLGSGVRLGNYWLAPTPATGIYQGTVDFPHPGIWAITITVKGPFVTRTSAPRAFCSTWAPASTPRSRRRRTSGPMASDRRDPWWRTPRSVRTSGAILSQNSLLSITCRRESGRSW